MAADVHTAVAFYATPMGARAGALVAERLSRRWPDLRAARVLGLGFAPPYLRIWREQGAQCFAAIPGQVGIARWPEGGPNLSCTVAEDALPFADLGFDRVLLVHGLEAAENARRLLREVWRVLRDDGRLLVVAPNRMGMWAHVETTPFGHGQPYSPGQIGRLLTSSMFRVEWRDTALYMPPLRPAFRAGRAWDQVGRRLAPRFAGVTITEAVKDVYAVIPAGPARTRRLVLSAST